MTDWLTANATLLGNAIPDRFANPGIESRQIMAGYSWSCNRKNSNNKDYKV